MFQNGVEQSLIHVVFTMPFLLAVNFLLVILAFHKCCHLMRNIHFYILASVNLSLKNTII